MGAAAGCGGGASGRGDAMTGCGATSGLGGAATGCGRGTGGRGAGGRGGAGQAGGPVVVRGRVVVRLAGRGRGSGAGRCIRTGCRRAARRGGGRHVRGMQRARRAALPPDRRSRPDRDRRERHVGHAPRAAQHGDDSTVRPGGAREGHPAGARRPYGGAGPGGEVDASVAARLERIAPEVERPDQSTRHRRVPRGVRELGEHQGEDCGGGEQAHRPATIGAALPDIAGWRWIGTESARSCCMSVWNGSAGRTTDVSS